MTPVRLQRSGAHLRLSGTLDRAAASVLWPQAATALESATVLDLQAVDAVDSAGLALLVALAERMQDPQVDGSPRGLDELRAAYRLTPTLSFDDNR
ncbi:STAS domain-containing protein [Thermomonas sp. HDW16]|uniref:STAS domain-containing protein n=1 Tax=Thermomonas sp. HDW16 TaxID=2714945 RepID=UPI00140A8D40|nr:STAS domain-containing protein [Thermomonas sp. HDW16]QIL19434.1 STAS domain-containing protein [Thermomonas sp. HDW16]